MVKPSRKHNTLKARLKPIARDQTHIVEQKGLKNLNKKPG